MKFHLSQIRSSVFWYTNFKTNCFLTQKVVFNKNSYKISFINEVLLLDVNKSANIKPLGVDEISAVSSVHFSINDLLIGYCWVLNETPLV